MGISDKKGKPFDLHLPAYFFSSDQMRLVQKLGLEKWFEIVLCCWPTPGTHNAACFEVPAALRAVHICDSVIVTPTRQVVISLGCS